MQRTIGLLQNELVRTTNENRDGLARILDTSDLDDFSIASSGNFLDEIGRSERLSHEVVSGGDRSAAENLNEYVWRMTN